VTNEDLSTPLRDATSWRAYALPINSFLYHSTPTPFVAFHDLPTWFAQDPLEGYKLVVYNELKRNDPDPNTGVAPPARAANDIFIRRVQTKKSMSLYLMSGTEAQSLAHLKTKYGFPTTFLDKTTREQVAFVWYGLKSNAPRAKAFIDTFCEKVGPSSQHKLDDWRNPFDQDEIMLCPTDIAGKVAWQNGFHCPAAANPGRAVHGYAAITTHRHPNRGLIDGLEQRDPDTHPWFVDSALESPASVPALPLNRLHFSFSASAFIKAATGRTCLTPCQRWRLSTKGPNTLASLVARRRSSTNSSQPAWQARRHWSKRPSCPHAA
jgi:hypothetical protein